MPGYSPPPESFPVGFLLPSDREDLSKPPGMLADPVDPRTGEYLSISRTFDPTDAAVLLAMSVERGSGASVEDVGHRFFDLERLDDQAKSYLEQETRRASKRLVDSGQIRIVRLQPITGDDWAEVQLEYENVARSEKRMALVPTRRLRP